LEPDFGFAEEGREIVDHRDLDVWKISMALAKEIYGATSGFPAEERFGLASQMKRAAISIPANIAEGYGRRGTTGAYIYFLRISQGSTRELETLVELAAQLGFLSPDRFAPLNAAIVRTSMMLRRLLLVLEKRNAR
jgi:four helix bundle protein